MKILITGGTGLIGTYLTRALLSAGHALWIVGRRPEQMQLPPGVQSLGWDGSSLRGWGERVSEMDAVVNLAGATIGAWPWSAARKEMILSSRVNAARIVAQAIAVAQPRPKILIQASGIGYYGPSAEWGLTEKSPAGSDYLAAVARQWEAASQAVEGLGVRCVIIRNAVVLERRAGVFPLMALPVKLFVGGPLGNGQQGVSWIHIEDEIRAICFLLDRRDAAGAFNLCAPTPVSNADFMRALAVFLQRPYWLPAPAFAMRLALGEMSTLILDGQYALPERLSELGFTFKYPTLPAALQAL
jgi:uncharacterized protein (TIGR01777 family)